MSTENKGRTAIVTGGGRGIGRAICVEFARQGIQILTCYAHQSQKAQETVALCEEYGVKAMAIQADVSLEADVIKLFDVAKNEFGGVDILINNAGITKDGLMLRMSLEDYEQVMDTNLKGAFLCTKAASKLMIKQRKGHIVFISSVVGLHGNAGQTNYAASKAGLIGLAKSVAKEFGSRQITANVIAPGFMQTDMTDALSEEVRKKYEEQIALHRLGNAEDIANTAYFLVSGKADYITGQVISVDGGM